MILTVAFRYRKFVIDNGTAVMTPMKKIVLLKLHQSQKVSYPFDILFCVWPWISFNNFYWTEIWKQSVNILSFNYTAFFHINWIKKGERIVLNGMYNIIHEATECRTFYFLHYFLLMNNFLLFTFCVYVIITQFMKRHCSHYSIYKWYKI